MKCESSRTVAPLALQLADWKNRWLVSNTTTLDSIGWSQQSDLFQAAVKPDCLMCHLATPASLSFGSAAGFFQHKAAIYADVCSTHAMPNAEIPYKRLWTSTWPIGNTQINLYGLMIGILGYTTCP